MVTQLRIFESNGFDPYRNLATEQHLLDITPKGACTLYLWQNKNTVVIGRNQNAWAECRHALLEEEDGLLARRLSGGGAVFHDLGNLNFTFIMAKEDYDLDRQLSVIQKACALAGISAERSGRNDLIADGRKFSGNAFYHGHTHAYHHGTLMVNVDKDKLGRYLSPPKAKLAAKGVASVRSRVVNLNELSPELTIDTMKQHMKTAFCHVYGLQAQPLIFAAEDIAAVDRLRERYAAWDYLFGIPLPFSFQCEAHFSWGHVQLQLDAKNGVITDVRLYTDAMDWSLPQALQTALTGCRFDADAIEAALAQCGLETDICKDIYSLLKEQIL